MELGRTTVTTSWLGFEWGPRHLVKHGTQKNMTGGWWVFFFSKDRFNILFKEHSLKNAGRYPIPTRFLTMKCVFFFWVDLHWIHKGMVRNLHWTHWDVRTMWCQTAWNWKWWMIVGRWSGHFLLGLMGGDGWEKWWKSASFATLKHTWMVDSLILMGSL